MRVEVILIVGVYVFSVLLCLASCQYIERVFENQLTRYRWLDVAHTVLGVVAFVPIVNTLAGVMIAVTCYIYEAFFRP
jgi:hypothetical protein